MAARKGKAVGADRTPTRPPEKAHAEPMAAENDASWATALGDEVRRLSASLASEVERRQQAEADLAASQDAVAAYSRMGGALETERDAALARAEKAEAQVRELEAACRWFGQQSNALDERDVDRGRLLLDAEWAKAQLEAALARAREAEAARDQLASCVDADDLFAEGKQGPPCLSCGTPCDPKYTAIFNVEAGQVHVFCGFSMMRLARDEARAEAERLRVAGEGLYERIDALTRPRHQGGRGMYAAYSDAERRWRELVPGRAALRGEGKGSDTG